MEELFKVVQVLLQRLDLLLFGFEAGLHLQCAMSQHLLFLLKVLNLKLLLEKLSLFHVKVVSSFLPIIVQCVYLCFKIFALALELLGDVNDRILPLLKLGNLNENLLTVVLLAFNITIKLADLVHELIDNIFVLFIEFFDLLELVSLLRCELFFVFHLQVIRDLLAVFVLALNLLQPILEVS